MVSILNEYYCLMVECIALSLLGGSWSLGLFTDKRFVDVRDDATAGDGGLDQGVQLLISTDCQLKFD